MRRSDLLPRARCRRNKGRSLASLRSSSTSIFFLLLLSSLPAHHILGKGPTTMNDSIKFTAAADIVAFNPHTLGEAPKASSR
jgi:hypothetical protein